MKIFIRSAENLIAAHPTTWNLPCELPRDSDCGIWIDVDQIRCIDKSLNTITWSGEAIEGRRWAHFTSVFVPEPTTVLGEVYCGNFSVIE